LGRIRPVSPLFLKTLDRLLRLPESGRIWRALHLQIKPMVYAAGLKALYSSAES
jgi:hypothetical protein